MPGLRRWGHLVVAEWRAEPAGHAVALAVGAIALATVAVVAALALALTGGGRVAIVRAMSNPIGNERPVDFQQSVTGSAATPAADPLGAAHDALEDHIENVLFNPRAAEGKRFRDQVLGWRTPADRTKFKREMLAVARAFTPGQDGWEKADSNGKSVYIGRVGGLYTEVEIDPPTGKATRVYVEVD
jgi:hypothetical protein